MEPLKKILLRLRNVFTKKDDSVIPTDFSDLAPLDSIDNTSEYLNALDWALKNRRIRNVALCGPYGAGKSSIINSYLKSHADAQQKSLRISMATFIESKTEGSDSSHSVALKPDEIETGILKQLFYKVPHTKIPQSRYRKLHKGGKLIAWRNLVLISIFLLLLGFIFAPDHVINVTNILYETWPFSTLPAKVAIVAFAILFTGVLGSIAWCFYPAFSRMKISSISISAKANVEGDEESKESIFNKNMDEIVYFFEETRYRYVFFEDLDRLNDAAIFVRLRELNTLLNNDDEIKDPVVFIYAVRDDIFSKVLKFYKTCGTDAFEALEESSDGYQAYEFVKAHKNEIETVNIILLTNDETVQYTPNDTHNGKVTIRFDVWDIERLYQTVLGGAAIERQLVVKLKKKYGTSLPLIKVKGDNAIYDCYIGVISGRLLAQIYEAEGQDLIQKNVRSFLQATGNVNKGIKASLANEPEMFMAYNNGISTIAESVAVDESQCNGDISTITEITGWQIVNGGQTTASIYNAYRAKLPLDQVNVQIKLSVIKQKDRAEDIIHNISKYANSQNKINMSDFNANDAYHVKMERLSRATPIPVAKGKSTDYWFYERARGQYLVELNRQPSATAKKEFKNRCPKSRCISKTVAAKCMMAYQGHPDIVSKGLETNFIYFSDMVSDGTFPEPSEQSYTEMIAKVILFNSCDKIIKNLKFGGFKAQQDYYTIALIGKYYSDLFHPQEIWNSQMISAEMAKTIEELAFFVWNHFQNPTVPGVNVGQWCKKEECWELLQARYENEYMQR